MKSKMRYDELNTIFILSKGRPNSTSANYLKSIDYPYWAIVVEDDEEYLEDYEKNFGEHVLKFHKENWVNFDTHDHYGNYLTTGPVPVRNFIIKHGQDNNLKRVWELDDDILNFEFFIRDKKKYTITDGKTLYKLCNILSTLADDISAEAISFKDSVFVRYGKTQLENLKITKNVIMMSIPCNTEILFDNRGYSDLSRPIKCLHKGLLPFEAGFALSKTKHEKTGGMADDRTVMTVDLANVCTLKDNPTVFSFLKYDKRSKQVGLRIWHRFSKLAPKIISSEYTEV